MTVTKSSVHNLSHNRKLGTNMLFCFSNILFGGISEGYVQCKSKSPTLKWRLCNGPKGALLRSHSTQVRNVKWKIRADTELQKTCFRWHAVSNNPLMAATSEGSLRAHRDHEQSAAPWNVQPSPTRWLLSNATNKRWGAPSERHPSLSLWGRTPARGCPCSHCC